MIKLDIEKKVFDMDLKDKAGAVGQLWIEFRNDEDFEEFMEYNDLGCPMAYMVAEGLIEELSPVGEEMITETFDMFINLLDVTYEELDTLEDVNLEAIMTFAHYKKQASPEE
jgi:hypothetical protein